MAIDTAMKRFSMLNMASPSYVRLWEPDGSVDGDDRAYILDIYGGNSLQAGDDTPDAFTFDDVTVNDLGETTTSNTITITGIDTSSNVTFVETGHISGEYSKNGGAWTDLGNTTVELNDTLALRLVSSTSTGTAVSIAVTIGGVSDTWTVTTSVTYDVGGSSGTQGGSRGRVGSRDSRQRAGTRSGRGRTDSRGGRRRV